MNKEVIIPDFLKMISDEEKKPLSRFSALVDEYTKKFDESPPTEPSTHTKDTWFLILRECIKQEKTVNELLEIEQNDEWLD